MRSTNSHILEQSHRKCYFFFSSSWFHVVFSQWGDAITSLIKNQSHINEFQMTNELKITNIYLFIGQILCNLLHIFDANARDRHTLSGIFKINWKDYVVDLAPHIGTVSCMPPHKSHIKWMIWKLLFFFLSELINVQLVWWLFYYW